MQRLQKCYVLKIHLLLGHSLIANEKPKLYFELPTLDNQVYVSIWAIPRTQDN